MPRKPKTTEPPPPTPSEVMRREATAVVDVWADLWRSQSRRNTPRLMEEHRQNLFLRFAEFLAWYGFLFEEFQAAVDREALKRGWTAEQLSWE